MRHQVAADLFGSFNRIVKNLSLNFLLTKFENFSFVISHCKKNCNRFTKPSTDSIGHKSSFFCPWSMMLYFFYSLALLSWSIFWMWHVVKMASLGGFIYLVTVGSVSLFIKEFVVYVLMFWSILRVWPKSWTSLNMWKRFPIVPSKIQYARHYNQWFVYFCPESQWNENCKRIGIGVPICND